MPLVTVLEKPVADADNASEPTLCLGRGCLLRHNPPPGSDLENDMINLRTMSIATRLAGGFALMAIIVLLLGAMSLRQTSSIHTETVEINDTWLPSLRDLTRINQDFMRYRIFALRSLLATDSQDMDRQRRMMTTLEQQLETGEATLEARIVDQDSRRIFTSFREQRRRYMTVASDMARAIDSGDHDAAIQIVDEQLNPLADATTLQLQELEQRVFAGSNMAEQRAEDSYRAATRMVVGAIIAAIVLTLVLAWLLTRSIIVPLRQAMRVSEVIATGDLTHAIEISGRDEASHLLRSLSGMQTHLRDTLQGIANSSSQLASAAEELNAVTEDATRNLQQQNDEVQQAATAVNEMSVAVDEVARNAVQTSEQSQNTAASARQGQEQVGQTLVSIEKLSGTIHATTNEVQALAEQTQHIYSVLDVIRAVAEQTNLLALNAAIEAARAGEHGRGFAVVADEVRALAHRTQQSTREIEETIKSIQQVTERTVAAMQISVTMAGNTQQQSQLAGEAFSNVSVAVGQINERNLVIASAAEEQAQVAQEVDRNLVNIRDLSTQSAAGAEQSSAASRELSRLAVELNTLINRFRT